MRKRRDKRDEETSSYLNSQNQRKLYTEDRKEEDIRKFIGLCRNICKVNITEESLEKAIRLSKVSDDKERPLLITLKEENKKREIFQNLNKICEAGDPFDKITVTHDLTVKQKEELKEKIVEEAREKERSDELGEFMYWVHGPPWSWFIKKDTKGSQPLKQEISKRSIHCLYTNADTLTNNMSEMKAIVAEHNPYIVAVTEVIPKNYRIPVQKAEIKISDEYDVFPRLYLYKGKRSYDTNTQKLKCTGGNF